MTKTTRARCQNLPEMRKDGVVLPKRFGEIITAQYRYPVVVQYVNMNWIKALQLRLRNNSLLPLKDSKAITLTLLWSLFLLAKIWNERDSRTEESKGGTASVLVQTVFSNDWWSDAVECHCSLRNIQDSLADGRTP